MAQQTVLGQWANEGVTDALAAMVAGDPLSGAQLHLYQSTFNPSRTNVAADFAAAEANYTGYAPVALTWSAIGVDAAGNVTALSTRAFFQATNAATPNNIGGAWLQKDVTGPPATHTVLEWYPFLAPLPMTTALSFIGVVLGMQSPGSPGYALVDN